MRLDFPEHPYTDVQEKYFKYADHFAGSIDLPYYPNVTMGWDSSPRASQEDPYENHGYPFMGTIADNTPENFKNALIQVREYLDRHPGAKTYLTSIAGTNGQKEAILSRIPSTGWPTWRP